MAFLSEETAGVPPLLSGLLREGHWRTACVRLALHLLDVIGDVHLAAVSPSVLYEAAEIQPSAPPWKQRGDD